MSDLSLHSNSVDEPHTSPDTVWSALRQELLYLVWALMEIAIITPLALTMMRWTRYWPPLQFTLWLFLLMLAPFYLVRWLDSLGLARKEQRRVVVVCLILTMLLTWRFVLFAHRPWWDWQWLSDFVARAGETTNTLWARDLTLFLLVILVWWRGLRLVGFSPSFYGAGLRLRAGALVLAPMAFILSPDNLQWGLLPFVLLYFGSGLMAVCFVRAEQIEQEQSGFSAALSPKWTGTVFLIAAAVMICAGFLAILISGDLARQVAGWLLPLNGALKSTTVVALSTVLFLSTPFLGLFTSLILMVATFFQNVLDALGRNFAFDLGNPLGPLQPFTLPSPEEVAVIEAPAILVRGGTLLAMLLVILLVSLAVTRFLKPPGSAAKESTTVRGLRNEDAPGQNWAQSLLGRLGLINDWRIKFTVRNIYRQMCRAAAGAGYPRDHAATPYEYQATLAEVWPGLEQHSLRITQAYVRIHYGELPESSEELRELRSSWERLSRTSPQPP